MFAFHHPAKINVKNYLKLAKILLQAFHHSSPLSNTWVVPIERLENYAACGYMYVDFHVICQSERETK
jgi:hypothetical protein